MKRTLASASLVLLALAAGCQRAAPTGHTLTPAVTLPRCERDAPRFDGAFPRARGGSQEVEPTWLAAHRCALRVIDVREADELTSSLGRIDVAEHVPLDAVERAAEHWDRDAPVVLVCRSGRRSERAAETLRALGFRRVASLTGGMLAWSAQGLPATRAPTVSAAPAASPAAPLTDAQVGALNAVFQRPETLVWTRVSTLLGSNTVSCIDGRAETPVLGAPGGDAGELVLSLAALEQELGHPVDAAWIASLFDRYVESFGRFYMHTDRHALDRLRAALRTNPRTAAYGDRLHDDTSAMAFVRAPPPAVEEALLDALTRPEHVGCGHLRLMMERPERYGVRAGLVADVLRAAFSRGWRRPELVDYVALDGDHGERGVLEVRIEHTVHAHTVVPMVAPHEGTRELFVLHPQVAAFIRAENADFLVERLTPEEARRVRGDALRTRIEELGERQLHATVAALAPTLPHYVLRVSEGRHSVESVERAP
jgi:rhodanese-related sulfurtransferase